MPETEPTGAKELRELECKLTQAEFNVRATEFAKLDERLDALETARKASNEAYKDQIGGVNAERTRLRAIVMGRSEKRDVPCSWHADWASKSMLLRRDDTGEVVEARTMTAQELQEQFDYTADDRQLPEHRDESDDQLDG